MASLWDRLLDGVQQVFEGARDDIRHKLVEEGWFGRQVTDAGLMKEHQEAWLGKEELTDGLSNVERLYNLHPNDPDLWGDPKPIHTGGMPDIPRQSFDELWATEDRAKGIEPPEKDHGMDL